MFIIYNMMGDLFVNTRNFGFFFFFRNFQKLKSNVIGMVYYPSRSIYSPASLSKSFSFSSFLLFFLFSVSKQYYIGTLDLNQARVPTRCAVSCQTGS